MKSEPCSNLLRVLLVLIVSRKPTEKQMSVLRTVGPRIACIHAMQGSISPTKRAFDAVWPEAARQNILDDTLSTDVQCTGLDAAMDRRFAELAHYARASSADGILFTCSAFGSCIEKVKAQHPDIPVLKPNEAMMEEAVRIGGRIGVLSVFGPTVGSIVHEMHAMALALGRDVEIVARFIPGALAVLQSGDEPEYNRIVGAAAASLHHEANCSVMTLAMFSMACCAPEVVARIPTVPVLTSPNSAVAKLKRLMQS
jgi:hypothetical protein